MKKDIVYSEKGTTFAAVIQNIINHDKSRTGKSNRRTDRHRSRDGRHRSRTDDGGDPPVDDRRGERLPARFREFHPQTPCAEGGAEHRQEHVDHDPRTQHSGFQAVEGFSKVYCYQKLRKSDG